MLYRQYSHELSHPSAKKGKGGQKCGGGENENKNDLIPQ